MNERKPSKTVLLGMAFFLLSFLLILILGLAGIFRAESLTLSNGSVIKTGLSGSVSYYFIMWDYADFPSLGGIFGIIFVLLAFVLLIAELIFVMHKKQYRLLLNAFFRFFSVAFIGFLVVFFYLQRASLALYFGSALSIAIAFCFTLASHVLLSFSYWHSSEKKGLDEEENVEGVGEALNLCPEDKKADDAELMAASESADDEPSKEDDDGECADGFVDGGEPEEIAQLTEDDYFAKLNKHRREGFESRIAASDEDLKAKYDELVAYIGSYGIKGRLSLPGITFSRHCERFVFITVSGKKLKAYFALDPEEYRDGTYPTVVSQAKKFEDLPVMMSVRSDLSLKRAKTLIDDVMAGKGISKRQGK